LSSLIWHVIIQQCQFCFIFLCRTYFISFLRWEIQLNWWLRRLPCSLPCRCQNHDSFRCSNAVCVDIALTEHFIWALFGLELHLLWVEVICRSAPSTAKIAESYTVVAYELMRCQYTWSWRWCDVMWCNVMCSSIPHGRMRLDLCRPAPYQQVNQTMHLHDMSWRHSSRNHSIAATSAGRNGYATGNVLANVIRVLLLNGLQLL